MFELLLEEHDTLYIRKMFQSSAAPTRSWLHLSVWRPSLHVYDNVRRYVEISLLRWWYQKLITAATDHGSISLGVTPRGPNGTWTGGTECFFIFC